MTPIDINWTPAKDFTELINERTDKVLQLLQRRTESTILA